MIRINLLPYREEAKKARRNQFFALCGATAVFGGLLVFFVYTVIEGYISNQEARNDFLKGQIARLDKQIDQIKKLQEQTKALLDRKQIIENLQRDRGETVHLLSELVEQVPEGIYLKSFKQEGKKVNLIGYAQSNARVSILMRNFDSSQWLEAPKLLEIKAVTVDKRRLNEFSMTVGIKTPKVDDGMTGIAQKEKK